MADRKPRPLLPGESIPNVNGGPGRSTEYLITVIEELLNNGAPTNIPSIWNVGEGKNTLVPQELAVELARQSGIKFPSYDSISSAETAAKQRSAKGGVHSGPWDQSQSPAWKAAMRILTRPKV